MNSDIARRTRGGEFTPEEQERMRNLVESPAGETGESGVLADLRGGRVSVVVQAQHQRSLIANTHEIYAALPLYHRVSGRILTAYLTPEQRAALSVKRGLPGKEWDNIDSLEKWGNACASIRKGAVMENRFCRRTQSPFPPNLVVSTEQPISLMPSGKKSTLLTI